MAKYKIDFVYYAGMGGYDTTERVAESREQLLIILNGVFQDDIMIDSLKIKRVNFKKQLDNT
jgi:hypothetical protein